MSDHRPTTREAGVTEDRVAALKRLIPEAFADGQLDPQRLKEALGEVVNEDTERYSFTWSGRRQAIEIMQMPSRATLRPERDESISFDSTKNAFIQGENLEVLKTLTRSYSGSVKLIYVDPPYNTGKDFIFNDDFTDPLDAYLRLTGQKDEQGNVLTSNPETSGRYHSRWLSMMYPRLFYARQLLADDGVILVSCNDIEQAHLKLLLAEIFGEENFLATFIWNNQGNIDNASKIKLNHEYIHAYVRDESKLAKPPVIDPNIEETSKLFNETIENSITKNGPKNPPSKVNLPAGFPADFDSGDIEPRIDGFPKIHQTISVKDAVLVKQAVVESGWSSRNLLNLFIDNGCVPIKDDEGRDMWFRVTESGAIYSYKERSEEQGHVLTVIRNVGTTKQNSSELARWGLYFDYPKPKLLIRHLCETFTRGDDLIVDFFAGSSTTAHAVLDLNRKDGQNRRFILVQLQEPIPDKYREIVAGRFNNIAEMSRARIRMAIKHLESGGGPVPADHATAEDLGFRAFRLDESHFASWSGVRSQDPEAYEEQMALYIDSLRPGWETESLLWEIAIREGLTLECAFQMMGDGLWRLAGRDGNKVFVSLADELDVSALESTGIDEGEVLICRDASLSDESAANLALRYVLKTI